jgi:hypothetical protein
VVSANCETTSEIVPEFARKLTDQHKGKINGSEFWNSSTDRPTRGCADMADVGCGFCDDRRHQRGDVPAPLPLNVQGIFRPRWPLPAGVWFPMNPPAVFGT